MTEGETVLIVLAGVWIGWPIWSIASDLRALRQLAERRRG